MTDTFTHEITDTTDDPFYTGVGATASVPAEYDVAINGRGYMLDTDHAAFKAGITTIPLVRQQADNSVEPGEATVNPEDLWPRAQFSWHKGAGQKYLDASDSDRNRFRASLGLDPWTRGQLSLLPTTSALDVTSNTNLQVIRVGDYLYFADGNDVFWGTAPYSTLSNSNIFVAETPQSVKSITTDGYLVYAALGSNGIHTNVRGATSSTHYSDLSATLVGYCKGRLMAANGNAIYNVIASGAAPSALLTHPNTDFKWVGFTEGTTCIYAAGFSGDKSLIYRTAVKADGTALDVPVIAGELPDGEIVRSIQGYLGFLAIGTDLGVRIASQDTSGNLTIGPLIPTGKPCRAFEPQDRFIWFGWENYDTTHTGMGRIDLTIFNDSGAPAYASDIMAAGGIQGQVSSIATDSTGKRIFAVQGHGFYLESTTTVATGSIDSGKIGFGLPDPKIALRFSLKHGPLAASSSVDVYVSADDAALIFVGSSDVQGSTSSGDPMRVPEVSAQLFELHLELKGSATTLERYDFRAYPTAARGHEITVPILLHEIVTTATGSEVPVDVRGEYDAIKGYEGSRQLVSYQELSATFSAIVEEVQYERQQATEDRQWWNGTLIAKLKVLGD